MIGYASKKIIYIFALCTKNDSFGKILVRFLVKHGHGTLGVN